MKLDLFKQQWLEMVFEGKNKSYGAYELRKKSPKMTAMALLAGAAFFALAIAAPAIIDGIFSGLSDDEANMDKKIVTIKLPPKEEKPKEILPPPPPPPPVDQVKFVKPEIAKADEVTEEPPKIKELDEKITGDKDLKGQDDAPIIIEKPDEGVADDNNLYSTAGIEVKPEYPGGIEKFYKYVANNYNTPEEEGLKGKVYVSFVVEKDGSLTDIKSVRDIGYGTGAEAVRVLKKCPKWTPGIQNGKPVRCTYTLPISIQSAE